jgi:hypothetical protein
MTGSQTKQGWYYQDSFGLSVGPITIAELQLAIDRKELGLGMRVREGRDSEWRRIEDLPAELGLRLPSVELAPMMKTRQVEPKRQTSLLTSLFALALFSFLAYVGFKNWYRQEAAQVVAQQQTDRKTEIFKVALSWLRSYRAELAGIRGEDGSYPAEFLAPGSKCPAEEKLRISAQNTSALLMVQIRQNSLGLCDIVGRLYAQDFPDAVAPTVELLQRSDIAWDTVSNVPGNFIAAAERVADAHANLKQVAGELEVARQRSIAPQVIALVERQILALNEFKALVEQNWNKRKRCADSNDKGMQAPEFYAAETRTAVFFYPEQNRGNCLIMAQLRPDLRLFPNVRYPAVFLEFNTATKLWSAGASVHALTEFKLSAAELKELEERR